MKNSEESIRKIIRESIKESKDKGYSNELYIINKFKKFLDNQPHLEESTKNSLMTSIQKKVMKMDLGSIVDHEEVFMELLNGVGKLGISVIFDL